MAFPREDPMKPKDPRACFNCRRHGVSQTDEDTFCPCPADRQSVRDRNRQRNSPASTCRALRRPGLVPSASACLEPAPNGPLCRSNRNCGCGSRWRLQDLIGGPQRWTMAVGQCRNTANGSLQKTQNVNKALTIHKAKTIQGRQLALPR